MSGLYPKVDSELSASGLASCAPCFADKILTPPCTLTSTHMVSPEHVRDYLLYRAMLYSVFLTRLLGKEFTARPKELYLTSTVFV